MMSDPTEGTPIAPPDPAVLRVIRPSAARLTQLEDVFTEQLQYEIGRLIPDLAEDDWAFCQRTVQALLWAALTDAPARRGQPGSRLPLLAVTGPGPCAAPRGARADRRRLVHHPRLGVDQLLPVDPAAADDRRAASAAAGHAP